MSTYRIELNLMVTDENGMPVPLTRRHAITVSDCKSPDDAVVTLMGELEDMCNPWRDGPVSE